MNRFKVGDKCFIIICGGILDEIFYITEKVMNITNMNSVSTINHKHSVSLCGKTLEEAKLLMINAICNLKEKEE